MKNLLDHIAQMEREEKLSPEWANQAREILGDIMRYIPVLTVPHLSVAEDGFTFTWNFGGHYIEVEQDAGKVTWYARNKGETLDTKDKVLANLRVAHEKRGPLHVVKEYS